MTKKIISVNFGTTKKVVETELEWASNIQDRKSYDQLSEQKKAIEDQSEARVLQVIEEKSVLLEKFKKLEDEVETHLKLLSPEDILKTGAIELINLTLSMSKGVIINKRFFFAAYLASFLYSLELN